MRAGAPDSAWNASGPMSWSTAEAMIVARDGVAVAIGASEIARLAARYSEVIVDLGTGDGRHVLRTARARPCALVVGVDPVAQAMAPCARRAASKPARGGVDNALFVVASLEALPAALRGLAREVTINYPWGSLLRAVAWPRLEAMRTVVELLAPGGSLVALLNASAGESGAYADRLDLPPLEDPRHVRERLAPGWGEAGLADVRWRYLAAGEPPPYRTTWGQRLVRGSGRETLVACGRRSAPSTSS